jgi:hypothetical protein
VRELLSWQLNSEAYGSSSGPSNDVHYYFVGASRFAREETPLYGMGGDMLGSLWAREHRTGRRHGGIVGGSAGRRLRL